MQAFKVAKIPSTLAPFPRSAHTQQFESLSTPYDDWKDTDRQGFFIHKGKTVCSKCLNAENSSILSWENTTTCTRCLNTDHVTTSLHKPKRGHKRQMPNHNEDAYGKVYDIRCILKQFFFPAAALVGVKGKTMASQHESQHHQPVYYTPENYSSPIHIEDVHRNLKTRQLIKFKRLHDAGVDKGDKLEKHHQLTITEPVKVIVNVFANIVVQLSGGQVYLRNEIDPLPYLKELFRDKHFLDNVRAYNQMFKKSNLKVEIVEGLIQTLDENNELVQVFRTARDKCNEGNVPEFKVQLYNVVATREYQLPSSGTLGAIVFEPDANSQTDFDMIIEYKDKQPKRINKLHSSYMSVQFPLLFVYGQPGYNTNLTLTGVNANRKRTKVTMNMYYKIMEAYIRDLRPRDRDKVIEAKVYRSWMARDPPDVTEKGYRAILLDKQGVRFTCDGVITSINTLREWYYPSSTKCNIKAEIHEGTFDCKAHGTVESPDYR
ncbi:helitron helicase-like domain-containing protein [Artemisia annua]|uniref:Helitron helicase-like domain-containing protein n=1 Tax=Artemisia annua TaxID=35608 RepID=A0A2U1P9S6_ARTAN|nr:helitron helicase-like domain-containing protein [Artemisia annua]